MSAHVYSATVAPRRERAASGALAPLRVAALCLIGLVFVWVCAAFVPATHTEDALLLREFTLLGRPGVNLPARFLLHLLDPTLFAIWGIAIVAFTLAQERSRAALAIVLVLCAAPLTSEALKPLLAHPHALIGGVTLGPATYPSGHATAALTLVLCSVLASPPRWRTLVAMVGALYTAAVGISLLILAWHMPSDVVGGFLVASMWMALAIAGLRAGEERRAKLPGPAAGSARPPSRAVVAGSPQRLV